MSATSHIHLIAKANISEHTVVPLPASSLPALNDGHIRVQTTMISLSSNNLSYAQLGSVRYWWDAYPLPSGLPSPYNDPSQYGIDPAWGYGEVLESKIDGVQVGTLLWGFWPTYDLPVDLQLVPADAKGHWIETSEHRQRLMTLYQRYVVVDSELRLNALKQGHLEDMLREAALRPVWEAGHLLNEFVFGTPPIHPLGTEKWDENDADLSSAVVVSLSASGKTARGFTNALINRRSPGKGPLGLLGITSIKNSNFIPKASFPTKTVLYEKLADNETMDWIANTRPNKIVVADFGGRGDSLTRLLDTLERRFQKAKIVVIGVGGSPQIFTPQDIGNWAQRNAKLESRVQMNTSGIRDAAMEIHGAEAYFKNVMDAWQQFNRSDSVSDIRVQVGEGVAGDNGFEGGWTKICEGKIPADVAMAYNFRF